MGTAGTKKEKKQKTKKKKKRQRPVFSFSWGAQEMNRVVSKKRKVEENGVTEGIDGDGEVHTTGKSRNIAVIPLIIQPKNGPEDELPEEGEILDDTAEDNADGVLSMLAEGEVGLWTTDAVDDQEIAQVEESGAARKVLSDQRKHRKKIAWRRKRAQKDRELKSGRAVKPARAICKHYMKGRCTKGEGCPFSHDAVPLTKLEPCKFALNSSCLKGEDCPYSHDLGAFPCKFFHTRGFCYDGLECLFSHKEISEEVRQGLMKRMEKDRKERGNNISALELVVPASMHLEPDLDSDPFCWGSLSEHNIDKTSGPSFVTAAPYSTVGDPVSESLQENYNAKSLEVPVLDLNIDKISGPSSVTAAPYSTASDPVPESAQENFCAQSLEVPKLNINLFSHPILALGENAKEPPVKFFSPRTPSRFIFGSSESSKGPGIGTEASSVYLSRILKTEEERETKVGVQEPLEHRIISTPTIVKSHQTVENLLSEALRS